MPDMMEAHRRKEAIAVIRFHVPEFYERRLEAFCQMSTKSLEEFAKQVSDIAWLTRFTDTHGHGGI